MKPEATAESRSIEHVYSSNTMFHKVAHRKPFVRQARKELDPEFAGASTHFPSHGRVNHKQIPSIPSYKAYHLRYPPKGHNESAMHFLEKTAGLSWEAAHHINLQVGEISMHCYK